MLSSSIAEDRWVRWGRRGGSGTLPRAAAAAAPWRAVGSFPAAYAALPMWLGGPCSGVGGGAEPGWPQVQSRSVAECGPQGCAWSSVFDCMALVRDAVRCYICYISTDNIRQPGFRNGF